MEKQVDCIVMLLPHERGREIPSFHRCLLVKLEGCPHLVTAEVV